MAILIAIKVRRVLISGGADKRRRVTGPKMSLPRLGGLARQDRDIEFLFANGALSAASEACAVTNHLAMILACVSPRDRREAELRLRVLGEHRSAFQTEFVLTAMFDAAIARDCMEWNFTVIDATRGPTTTH